MKLFINRLKILTKFLSVQILLQALGMVSGLIVIRILTIQEYGYFTLAISIQSAMDLLADLGIGSALLSIGGKVWQDSYKFSQLINTAIKIRYFLARFSCVLGIPVLFYILTNQGISFIYAFVIVIAILAELNFRLSSGVLSVVPQLHTRIHQLQIADALFSVSRLSFLSIGLLIHLNASIVIVISTISSGIKNLTLHYFTKNVINKNAGFSKEYEDEIFSIGKALLPSTIYYVIQGQLTVWLITIFGNLERVAEIGALGRLGILLILMNSVIGNLVLPNFSKIQSFDSLVRRYFQIIFFFLVSGSLLIIFSLILPDQLLWILGKNYSHLGIELAMLATSTAFISLVGGMWSINCSKSWLKGTWIYVPSTIIMQAILIFVLDLSTVRGAILFGGLSQIPFFVVNIYLTTMGFRSLYNQNHENSK